MNKDNLYKVIDSCSQFELTVAQLYLTYSTTFPEEREKWMEFAEEELMHAEWLSIIKSYVEDETISLKLTNISIQSTDRATSFIQDKIQNARNGSVNLHSALLCALQIEGSIIEKSFLKMFNFSNKKAEDIRRYIFKETIGHQEKLQLWFEGVDAAQVKAA